MHKVRNKQVFIMIKGIDNIWQHLNNAELILIKHELSYSLHINE